MSGTIEKLTKLNNQHGFVSNKTASLHEACEQMLIDQNKLSALADDLEKKVSYFIEYEKIQSQLSSPTLSVHGELFHDILDRLDKCIDYMQSHVNFKTIYMWSCVILYPDETCLFSCSHNIRTRWLIWQGIARALTLHCRWFEVGSSKLWSSVSSKRSRQKPLHPLLVRKYLINSIKYKNQQLVPPCCRWWLRLRAALR